MDAFNLSPYSRPGCFGDRLTGAIGAVFSFLPQGDCTPFEATSRPLLAVSYGPFRPTVDRLLRRRAQLDRGNPAFSLSRRFALWN